MPGSNRTSAPVCSLFVRVRLALASLGMLVAAAAQADALSKDESVVFMPGVASYTAEGVALDVHSFIFEYERRPGVHTAFRRYLDLDALSMTASEAARFRERTQLFRIDAERRKTPEVRLWDGSTHTLQATDKLGRADTQLSARASDPPAAGWLEFKLHAAAHPQDGHSGRALLLAPTGWSLVSDIDDTIKLSDVRDRRELLLNTFVRTYQPVAGVAELYRALAEEGMAFHYVSASPVQLTPVLLGFLEEHGFPAGSLHLRTLDLVKEVFGDGSATPEHKRTRIRALLTRFPQRRFVLVGDSGEADPEIYAALLKDHPQQVQAVLIRNVSGEARSARRYAALLSGDLAERLRIWSNADELGAALPAR